MILAARTGKGTGAGQADPETKPLEPVPFANAAPPPTEFEEISLGRETLQAFVGAYEIKPGQAVVITLSGDRLTAAMPGYPEVDIFPDTPLTFFAKAAPVRFRFERDPAGAITALVVSFGGRNLAARRKI